MSVLKGFERSDIYITDYESKKQWKVTGSCLVDLGVDILRGYSGSIPYYYQEQDEQPYRPFSGSADSKYREGTYNGRLIYEGLKHLYYSGSEGNGTFTGSSDLSLQTTLTISGSRKFEPQAGYRTETGSVQESVWEHEKYPSGIVEVNFPREVIGVGIDPGTFVQGLDKWVLCYVEEQDSYIDYDYFEDLTVGNVEDFEGILLHSGFTGQWIIPGEGSEYKYPYPDRQTDKIVGDIVYNQGKVLFTDTFLRWLLERWDCSEISWKSRKPVYTYNMNCSIKDIEFNHTFNPTAQKLLGKKEFTPYITAVGIYNNEGELLAVAKVSKPIKKTENVDLTFLIRLDIG